jgi:hypothetical protein
MSRANSSPNIRIPASLIVEITMVEHHWICHQCINFLLAPQQSNKVQWQAPPIFLHFYTYLWINDGRAWQPLDNSLSFLKFLPSLWDINWIGNGFYCFASLASPIHGMLRWFCWESCQSCVVEQTLVERCFMGQVLVEFATSPTTTSGIHTMFPSGQHHEV